MDLGKESHIVASSYVVGVHADRSVTNLICCEIGDAFMYHSQYFHASWLH